MKQLKTTKQLVSLFYSALFLLLLTGMAACSKKSNPAKFTAETAVAETPAPPPVPEKDGMVIKRDKDGNFVIQLVMVDLEAVKLMKPVKEGYVVWMTNDANVASNIGTVEGANTWNNKKDVTRFEAVSAVKPVKVFVTAETDLKTKTPGKQVVWSTGG